MTEADWQSSTDVWAMLECLRNDFHFNRSRRGRRRLRLYGCACLHSQVQALESDHPGRLMFEGAERYAEGLITKMALAKARRAYFEWLNSVGDSRKVASDLDSLGHSDSVMAARTGTFPGQQYLEEAALLRHIVGNPFPPRSSLSRVTAAMIMLAEALYAGEPCSFALHDALLEAGHPELAEHFRDPDEWHPKGCWALDLILGKS